MLPTEEVARGIGEVADLLPKDHPLLQWKRGLEAGAWFREGDESGRLASEAMLEAALQDAADQYCQALALSILCDWLSSNFLDEDVRCSHLKDAYRRISDLADAAQEPILEYWIADAAHSYAEGLKPAFSAEMQMLICRLGRRLRDPLELPLRFYTTTLFKSEEGPLATSAYCAPARMSLVRHLRSLVPAEWSPFLALVEMRCESTLALRDADDGRLQGVIFHASELWEILSTFEERYPGVWTSEAPPFEEVLGYSWFPDWFSAPFEALADAYLLVGMSSEALDALSKAHEIDPYQGSVDDLELLRRVLASAES